MVGIGERAIESYVSIYIELIQAATFVIPNNFQKVGKDCPIKVF